MRRIVAALKEHYPVVKSELRYETPMQFLAAVIMSAQFTDKGVNALTESLWKRYKTPADFASEVPTLFAQEIQRISYFNSKARYIVESARIIQNEFGGSVPQTKDELLRLPGVASKTANVVLGELFDVWSGIPVDTHVKRFVRKFSICTTANAAIIERELCSYVPPEDWKYVNNGLVLYGRYVCPARPHDCREHFLTKLYPEAARIWPKTA